MKKSLALVLALLLALSSFTFAAEADTAATAGKIAELFCTFAGWDSAAPYDQLKTFGELPAEDGTMEREDFFCLLGNVLGLTPAEKSTSIYKFADAFDIDEALVPMMCRMYTRSIMTGDTENNVIRPKDAVTVAEVEDALDRAYNRKFAPQGMTLIPTEADYLVKNFNRFGKMDPPIEAEQNILLLKEKPFHIVDNIYFVGNTWTSTYLIDTGEGLILIDGSTEAYFPLLLESIYELGFDPADIKYLVLSHAHGDHYGCTYLLQDLAPDAITFVGDVDAPGITNGIKNRKYEKGASYTHGFIPDVLVKDYDYIELGNTKIQAVTTPGHTDGVQSHFWTTPSGLKVGLYGGAGFSSMASNRLASRGYDEAGIKRWQEIFVESIDKVWDYEVDVMLGNHPFHADLFEKSERVLAGDENAFIDPTEWHRFLQELKDSYAAFLTLTPEEVTKMYTVGSLWVFRDIHVDDAEWPWVEELDY